MLAEGVWAEVKVGAEHLRLFSEHNALGVQAQGISVCGGVSQTHGVYLELPPLEWKKSRSA
jgi:hypothetical protein